jgi:ribosomal protein S18 acetylase RimI-like enzyme
MKMTYRQANTIDASKIAKLMLFAMDKIVYDFIGEKNENKAIDFLVELIKKENNQYSYQNITIFENENNEIVGMTNIYDGAKLNELRKPVLDLLEQKFNQTIHPQDETEKGEFYIDTIAVFPEYRGLGIGQKILDYIINEYAINQNKIIGLLVDLDNPNAKRLYTNKGFVKVGEKQLMNEYHEHLQYKKGS